MATAAEDEKEEKESDAADAAHAFVPHHLRSLASLLLDNRSGEVSDSWRQRMQAAKASRERLSESRRRQRRKQRRKQQRTARTAQLNKKQTSQADDSEQKRDNDGVASQAALSAPAAALCPPAPESSATQRRRRGCRRQRCRGRRLQLLHAEPSLLSVAPQMKIVNGAIVVNEDSLLLPSPSSLPPLITAAA